MENVREYIESGILESYLMGSATTHEAAQVEQMAAAHEEVRKEIGEISHALECYAHAHAIIPDPTIKPFLMATIDYTERMENGEQPSFPPELQEGSRLSDYAEWLNRPDMILPSDFKDFYAKIIGYSPGAISAIVWISDMAPQEVHQDEYEKFLVVEGTCNITIGAKVHQLGAGDYLAIPLYENHMVQVTSSIPCKVILQRIAA